jgi:hypothetical protein
MPVKRPMSFFHKHFADGTHQAICTACFAVVCEAADESQLQRGEENHACRGFALETLFHPNHIY